MSEREQQLSEIISETPSGNVRQQQISEIVSETPSGKVREQQLSEIISETSSGKVRQRQLSEILSITPTTSHVRLTQVCEIICIPAGASIRRRQPNVCVIS